MGQFKSAIDTASPVKSKIMP